MANLSKDHNSSKNQSIKSKFVDREVLHLASHLISNLAGIETEYQDEIINVCSQPDPDNEDEYFEAYEHWIVSDILGRELKERGELVEDIMGFTIWGRCTTGQAIMLDGVISRICEDMEILDGQKYEWSV